MEELIRSLYDDQRVDGRIERRNEQLEGRISRQTGGNYQPVEANALIVRQTHPHLLINRTISRKQLTDEA